MLSVLSAILMAINMPIIPSESEMRFIVDLCVNIKGSCVSISHDLLVSIAELQPTP